MNGILNERISSINDKKIYSQSYQCCNCTFGSEYMNKEKKEEHMKNIHDEIEKECYVEPGRIAVEIYYIFNTFF